VGFLSPWHLLIAAAVGVLIFGGRDKLSSLLGDFGKGLREFRRGLKEEHDGLDAAVRPPPSPAGDVNDTTDAKQL